MNQVLRGSRHQVCSTSGSLPHRPNWSISPAQHRPYVVLKIATSLDGRVACEDKTSQWITQACREQSGKQTKWKDEESATKWSRKTSALHLMSLMHIWCIDASAFQQTFTPGITGPREKHEKMPTDFVLILKPSSLVRAWICLACCRRIRRQRAAGIIKSLYTDIVTRV